MKKRCALLLTLMLLLSAAQAEPLFEPTQEGIYNYCPAGFVEDGVTHLYYCTNVNSRVVTDHIGYRRSTDGVHYSEETIVLANGKKWDAWDAIHVCDPDVVKGEFKLVGEVYNYLMVYLGCQTGNNQGNEIGLAVAKRPEGPFLRVNALNPFVPFTRDLSQKAYYDIFQWGVGQASLVSLDRKGQILLIYTRGDLTGTRLVCEAWDVNDLNAPRPLGDVWRREIANRGVIGRDMRPATLLNADFAYEPTTGRLYMVADGAPCYIERGDEPGEPTFVSSNLRVMRYSQSLPPDKMSCFFLNDTAEAWETLALIGRAETSYPRNHNAGLLTDPYGWIEADAPLQILFSVSETKAPNNSLWTYRIHQYAVKIP